MDEKNDKVTEFNDEFFDDLSKDFDDDFLNQIDESNNDDLLDITENDMNEINKLIEEIKSIIEKRRILFAELKELRARGDKLTPEELKRINEINAELKSLPTIKELEKEIRRCKHIIKGFTSTKGKYKIIPPQIEVPTLDSENESGLDNSAQKSQQMPKQNLEQKNILKQGSQNQQIITPINNSRPMYINSNGSTNVSTSNEDLILKNINDSIKHGNERKAEGLHFSYIKPKIDDGKIVSFCFVQEFLDKINEDNTNFSKDPLNAYKHALENKIKMMSDLKFYDKKYLKNVKELLLDSFKKDLENKDYNLCVEKYISIKTALTKEEFNTVVNDKKYPLADYNVNMVSFSQDKKSLFKRHIKDLTFEKVRISSEELHGEHSKKSIENFRYKLTETNKKIKFKRIIKRTKSKNKNVER